MRSADTQRSVGHHSRKKAVKVFKLRKKLIELVGRIFPDRLRFDLTGNASGILSAVDRTVIAAAA